MRVNLRFVFDNFERWLTNVFILLMVFSVLMQLFSRIFGNPVSWGEEVARYAYIWFAFMAAAFLVRTRQHIRVAYFLNFLPDRYQRITDIVQNIIIILCIIYILPSAFDHAIEVYGRRSPALEMPMFYVYISFPVGMVLLILRMIGLVIEDIKLLKHPQSNR
ncbi:MAG: TRAP transporter small permease [Deltaproteobacteria bacterium]|nr:TRAP transporter small permease [Deltaproteobacteria bacterium]MBW1994408.1 TRAP transporter small permease [Deltaproteobacteria bacterium]MBW2154431.1 TRAP transporter small permease [Deltaproteobacteria bacterium]